MKKVLSVVLVLSLISSLSMINLVSAQAQPAKVTFVDIAAGSDHSMALRSDGTVWCWGDNGFGQAADGTKGDNDWNNVDHIQTKPTMAINQVKSIASTYEDCYAVTNDGSLWAWGFNHAGRIGNGGTYDCTLPVRVLTNVKQVASGKANHSVAVKNDGTIWAWGLNMDGQVGNGTKTNYSTPVYSTVKDVKFAAAGEGHTMAIKNNGDLYMWGRNWGGQLGDGTKKAKLKPVKVMSNVIKAIAGSNQSCFITKDGTLWGCGKDMFCNSCSPKKLLTGVKDASVGLNFFVAVKTDGSLWACGENEAGQLGDGTVKDKYKPVKIMDNVAKVAAGNEFVLIIKKDGTLWSCGNNRYGQLGLGDTQNRSKFVQVTDFPSSGIRATAGRLMNSMALDGSLNCWKGIKPVKTDPAGDAVGGAGDITELYAAMDDKFLYGAVKVSGNPIVTFEIDTNGDNKDDYVALCYAQDKMAFLIDMNHDKGFAGYVPVGFKQAVEFKIPLALLKGTGILQVKADITHKVDSDGCNDYDLMDGWYTLAQPEQAEDSISSMQFPAINPLFKAGPDIAGRTTNRIINPRSIMNFMHMDWEGYNNKQCDNPISEEILRSHVNLFCPGFFNTYSDDEISGCTNNVNFSKNYGIDTFMWVSSNGYEMSIPDNIKSKFMTVTMKDVDGNTVASRGIGNTPMSCQNNPEWLKMVENDITIAAEHGIAGFGVDEPYNNYESVMYGGCFCDHCMEGFREYLKSTMSTDSLKKLGINDINKFNYADYIKQKCYKEYQKDVVSACNDPEKADFRTIPLNGEFEAYQYKVCTDYMKSLRKVLDGLQQKLGRKIPLAANIWDLRNMGAADTLNCVTPEININKVPDTKAAVAYELGNSIDAPVLGSPNSGDWEVMTGPDAVGLMKIYTAEAYAHGAIMSSPYASPFFRYGANNDKELYGKLDMNQLYPYYDYIYDNPMLFENLWPMAQVGVLYSNGAMDKKYGMSDAEREFWEDTSWLLASNIPIKVIFDGDGVLSQKRIKASDLKGLKVVVLPGDVVLDNADKQILSDFIKNGGQVISYNAEKSIQGLKGLKVVERGSAVEIFSSVNEVYRTPFEIDEKNISAVPYFNTDINGYVYHLVNYSFDPATHNVVLKKNIKFTLVNDLPFEAGKLGIYCITPENNKLVKLDYTVSDGKLVVTIPQMSAWASLVIRQSDKIGTLYNQQGAKANIRGFAR